MRRPLDKQLTKNVKLVPINKKTRNLDIKKLKQ